MWSDYFFYLMGLPEGERKQQIIIMTIFWIVMFLISVIIEIVKRKIKK